MSFIKTSTALFAVLAVYLLIFNYNIVDYIHVIKQRTAIHFPTGIRFTAISESALKRSIPAKISRSISSAIWAKHLVNSQLRRETRENGSRPVRITRMLENKGGVPEKSRNSLQYQGQEKNGKDPREKIVSLPGAAGDLLTLLENAKQVSSRLVNSHANLTRLTSGAAENSSPISNNVEKDPPKLVVPFYETYEEMMRDDEHTSKSRIYLNNTWCPYLGLRKPYITSRDVKNGPIRQPNTTCQTRQQSLNDCKEAVKYYGKPGSIKAQSCSSKEAVVICSILGKGLQEQRKRSEISCDDSQCNGRPVMLAFFSNVTGMIDKDWKRVPDIKLLPEIIYRHVSTSRLGSGFALLKCEESEAWQVLTLGKISRNLKKRPIHSKKREHVNVNIVLEDSVSRTHFYRTLIKTASAFRKIIYDQSIPASVLEFEIVQSYASNTYKNIQRLFAGRKYVDSQDKMNYGVQEFFTLFKTQGYTTLFQEDNCWYDTWGSLLDPRQRVGLVEDDITRIDRWQTFKKILKTTASDVIDDFGMTFLTCSAYRHLNTTNIFNTRKFPKVCFKGRQFSSLFLEYVKEYVTTNDDLGQPFISYTHLLTAHERKARRIVNDDALLSELFLDAAYLRNTLTVFVSDHGAKTNAFSTYTTQGRQEVFQPFIFIIVPHTVREMLGSHVMDALVVNQKRLLGLEDLHYALTSLPGMHLTNPHTSVLQEKKLHQEIPAHDLPRGEDDLLRFDVRSKTGGLFQILPLNRTCEELHVLSDVLCLCKGMDTTVPSNSSKVLWAAEFALGSLNNRIQNQYIASLKTKHAGYKTSAFHGYGACQRYTGLGVTRARRVIKGERQALQFSLLVQPYHIDTVEIFDAQVIFPVHADNGITLGELVRVSPFNSYEECADEGVDPKLCTCQGNNGDLARSQREFVFKASTSKSFSLQPRTYILDYPCLVIITRLKTRRITAKHFQAAVVTYEAMNACANVTYSLTFDIKEAAWTRLSRTEAFNITVLPRTMTFLITINNEWRFGKVVPKFEFVKKPVIDHT